MLIHFRYEFPTKNGGGRPKTTVWGGVTLPSFALLFCLTFFLTSFITSSLRPAFYSDTSTSFCYFPLPSPRHLFYFASFLPKIQTAFLRLPSYLLPLFFCTFAHLSFSMMRTLLAAFCFVLPQCSVKSENASDSFLELLC